MTTKELAQQFYLKHLYEQELSADHTKRDFAEGCIADAEFFAEIYLLKTGDAS